MSDINLYNSASWNVGNVIDTFPKEYHFYLNSDPSIHLHINAEKQCLHTSDRFYELCDNDRLVKRVQVEFLSHGRVFKKLWIYYHTEHRVFYPVMNIVPKDEPLTISKNRGRSNVEVEYEVTFDLSEKELAEALTRLVHEYREAKLLNRNIKNDFEKHEQKDIKKYYNIVYLDDYPSGLSFDVFYVHGIPFEIK